MLRVPSTIESTTEFAKEIVDECMATSDERAMVYSKAMQYYYTGAGDSRAALHNKVMPFVDRLAGYLYQPSGVRFNLVFDSAQPPSVTDGTSPPYIRSTTASSMRTGRKRSLSSANWNAPPTRKCAASSCPVRGRASSSRTSGRSAGFAVFSGLLE